MKNKLVLSSLTILALVVSACAAATPIPASPTSVVLVPVTGQATNTPSTPLPNGPAAVNIGQSAALGSFLVDSKGMTLYIFLNDTANTSKCTGTCAANWPPLLTGGAPTAGTGVNASLLGTITRTDGGTQVTYNGMPLYYFVADKTVGDTKGQGVKSVWYVIDPTGKSVTTALAAPAVGSNGSAVVNVAQTSTLGSFLVDSKGMTLYLYLKDTPNTSNCSGACVGYWPPLLTTGVPAAGTGVTASMLGTTKRADGTTQVTYNGWPLYYYVGDKVAGDTNGENVQSIWFVITPAGLKK